MKNFITEFKQFAMKGNVMDLAVGVIIGGAFGKIVSSLVGDIITPILGLLLNGISFQGIMIGPIALGNFLQALIDFIIVAFVIFLIIKSVNVIRRKQEIKEVAVEAKISREEHLLTEIRDLLRRGAHK